MAPAPHVAYVEAQVAAHAPAEQTWPAGHALPQEPQFLLSDCESTQVPAQSVDVSPMQVAPHVASEQYVPAPHFVPQAPQLFGSTWTAAQAALDPVPHSSSNGAHLVASTGASVTVRASTVCASECTPVSA